MCRLMQQTLVYIILNLWIGSVGAETCEANDLRTVVVRLRELATENNLLANEIKDLRKVSELATEFNTTVTRLESEITNLKKENEDLRRLVLSTNDNGTFIAFSLDMVLPEGDIVIFNTTRTNSNGVYNPSTGKFTAQVNGNYLFIVQFCALLNNDGNWFQYYIRTSSGRIAWNTHYHGDGCSTQSILVLLETSTEVWVEMDSNYDLEYFDRSLSSFSGVLLSWAP